ncbi:RNA binding effector protein [Calycina marina]|uniref:RNA binding effector protein n=1 Tax=Calycina marina TaxID=1763456 RepID=A0A9P7YZV8_9HELO|nr:RNA binding effector protein [Calycina marina]
MSSEDFNVLNGRSKTNGTSPAEKLQQQHHGAHNPTIEDEVDEADLKHSEEPVSTSVLEGPDDESAPPMPEKTAGKRKEESPKADKGPKFDPKSEDHFPALGGGPKPSQPSLPQWNKAAGASSQAASNGRNGAPRTSTPVPVRQDPRRINIPGKVRETYSLQNKEILPRKELKKPMKDLLRDISKKSGKVTVTSKDEPAGTLFIAEGPNRELVLQALRDVVAQVGAKVTEKVTIPQSTRAHIIGKAGSKIKEIQDKGGARVHIPKMEESNPGDEDDDATIEISIEGTALSVATARTDILKIAGERTPPVNSKLRNIPAELYPFISGNEQIKAGQGIDMNVPQYHTWKTQAPPASVQNLKPAVSDFITLSGERVAVQAMKTQIEQFVEQLQAQLAIEQFIVERARHQFIIGRSGISADDFFAQTGCAIILPHDEDEEEITIIGLPDKIKEAKKKAQEQHSSMGSRQVDLKKYLSKKAKSELNSGAQDEYVENLTQYLQQRRAVQQLENDHNAHIVVAGSDSWSIFSRDQDSISNATTETKRIVNAHPPSRMARVPVDPFYHQHLSKDIAPKTKADFGVHIIVPDDSADHILLVFEGGDVEGSNYTVPREEPSADEVKAFLQGLQEAQKHIQETLSSQAKISASEVNVPEKYHSKLKRFIKAEMDIERASGNIPVRVIQSGTKLTLRGPTPGVEKLAEKIDRFVQQAVQDDKERGYIMSFDFPQKHANQLIGKGGSFINELREKFDVDIKVDNGQVELKGPKAKAEAARSHITKLGGQWADEATHTVLIDSKFHREVIGQGGVTINKLQKKHNVQIHFPRQARPVKDDQSNGDAVSDAEKKSSRRDQAPNEVIIKGPKKGADAAREEILDLIQYLKDNDHTATVSVQQAQLPSLIGSGGKYMDELRATTGARIDIPHNKDAKDGSAYVDVTIKGAKSQVAQAKKLIEEKKSVFDNTITKSFEADKKYHRALIGGGGSKLREIVVGAGGSDDRRELARTVQFPKQEADGNHIKIEGNKAIVDKIIVSFEKIIADLESQTSETIEVSTDKHRSLIGRGGETKKGLEAEFKVSLDIPRQGTGETGIKISGKPENVESAKARILSLIKEQEGETIQVAKNLHHIISDNGQFFRRLQSNLQVTVNHDRQPIPPKPSVPSRASGGSLPLITDDDDSNTDAHSWVVVSAEDSGFEGTIPWVLRGNAENVAKAKSQLLAAIDQASKNTATGFLVLPDPSSYRFVIGQGGSKVNSIRKATGCKITVPRDQNNDGGIEISGSADGIAKAKDLVLEAVQNGKSGN